MHFENKFDYEAHLAIHGLCNVELPGVLGSVAEPTTPNQLDAQPCQCHRVGSAVTDFFPGFSKVLFADFLFRLIFKII